MTKAKEIFIFIVVIIIGLALIYGLLGCKEKAEADSGTFSLDGDDYIEASLADFTKAEKIFPPEISNDIVFTYDHNGVTEELIIDLKDNMIVCNQSPKIAIEIIYKTLCKAYDLNTSIDLDTIKSVRFVEPNEPEPNEPCNHVMSRGGGCKLCIKCGLCYTCGEISEKEQNKPEPNKPIATKIIKGQTFYDMRVGVEPEERMWIFDGDKFILLKDDPESNEPEIRFYARPSEPEIEFKITCTMYGCDGTCSVCDPFNPKWAKEPELNEPLVLRFVGYNMNRYIPTWPVYIELEKKLVFEDYSDGIQFMTTFRKGTKIYFKD